jgi:hypothetical protein
LSFTSSAAPPLLPYILVRDSNMNSAHSLMMWLSFFQTPDVD